MEYKSKQLEDFLKDLSPNFKKELLLIVEIKCPKNRSQMEQILLEFRKNKAFIKVGRFTKKYWEQRGWNPLESELKKKENSVNNFPNGSPMQIEYWTRKINPTSGVFYTEVEAKYKIKSQRKFNVEYWLERGMSLDEAQIKIKDFQKENSSRRKKFFGVTWNQYEYWMKKENLTEKQAKEKVSDLQKTFDLEKLIDRYGDIEGAKRYNEMCKNLAHSQSLNGFIERYGKEIGNERYREAIAKRCSNSWVSKESIIFFIKIYKKIREKIERNHIHWGIGGSKEYFIYDPGSTKIFFYDFTIPSIKLILEYHGKRYHPNPKWNTEKWEKWDFMGMDADTKRNFDLYKNKVAEDLGFEVIEIFSDDLKKGHEHFFIEMISNEIIKKISSLPLR